MDLTWSFLAVIVGGLLSLVGTLIVLNLRSIKKCLSSLGLRIDRQDERIEKHREDLTSLAQNVAACKIDCDRTNVSKEDWVRSEGYTRQELKSLGKTLNRIEGKFVVIEKLPEICGNIAREVVKEINIGDQNNG